MTEESLTPILANPSKETSTAPLGRRVDNLAAGLAAIGALFGALSAAWFFFGFAENDTRPEHLASALFLTLSLFIFAIGPFLCAAVFARTAYRHGTKRAHLFWTLFLMLPWVGLGLMTVIYTPLPLFVGLTLAGLAAILTLWAMVSLILDWNTELPHTLPSQQNEMSVTPE